MPIPTTEATPLQQNPSYKVETVLQSTRRRKQGIFAIVGEVFL